MTSVGDTSGYSIAWFSPNQTFASVDGISFAVNLTDLGERKWWKVGVVSDTLYQSTYPALSGPTHGFLLSNIGSASLDGDLSGPDRLVVSWGPDHGGFMSIGNTFTGTASNPTPLDKMTRHPVSLVDNHNGTVTFTVAGVSVTGAGAFPACPCRVVFYDHSYTPNKAMFPRPPNPYTWHWDSIVVT
jgi:hypothetical protein